MGKMRNQYSGLEGIVSGLLNGQYLISNRQFAVARPCMIAIYALFKKEIERQSYLKIAFYLLKVQPSLLCLAIFGPNTRKAANDIGRSAAVTRITLSLHCATSHCQNCQWNVDGRIRSHVLQIWTKWVAIL